MTMKIVRKVANDVHILNDKQKIVVHLDSFIMSVTVDGRAYDVNNRGQVLDVWNYTTDENGQTIRPFADHATGTMVNRAIALALA